MEYRNVSTKSDWDYLLAVVSYIENELTVKTKADVGSFQESIRDVTYTFSVEIRNNQCTVHRDVSPQYHGTEEDFLDLYDWRNKSKKKAVVKAIKAFFKYYEKETKNK